MPVCLSTFLLRWKARFDSLGPYALCVWLSFACSGVDVLTAMDCFPHARRIVMLADLSCMGPGTRSEFEACFADKACVRAISRTTFKVVHNWANHHFAWLETKRMKELFASTGAACTATLAFLMHVRGHALLSIEPLQLPAGSRFSATVLHAADVNVTYVSGISLPVSAADPTLTQQLDTHVLSWYAHTQADAPAPAPTLYGTMIKAAPDDVSASAWFVAWVLARSAVVLQDETGLPPSAFGAHPWVATIHGNFDGMQRARRFWKIRHFPNRASRDADVTALRASEGLELPFRWGYAAPSSQCNATARARIAQGRFNPALKDWGAPCNGILLLAVRRHIACCVLGTPTPSTIFRHCARARCNLYI